MIGPSFQQFVEFSLVHRMHVVVVYDGKRAAMKAERLAFAFSMLTVVVPVEPQKECFLH